MPSVGRSARLPEARAADQAQDGAADLLILHRPGFSYAPLAPRFAPWTAGFTLAFWDQPGAGHISTFLVDELAALLAQHVRPLYRAR